MDELNRKLGIGRGRGQEGQTAQRDMAPYLAKYVKDAEFRREEANNALREASERKSPAEIKRILELRRLQMRATRMAHEGSGYEYDEQEELLPSDRGGGGRLRTTFSSTAFSVPCKMELPFERPLNHEFSGMGADVPYKYKHDWVIEKKVHPSVLFNFDEWTQWHSLACNMDYLAYPPLLQYDEVFSRSVEHCDFMKCILCKLLCPPPPYTCDNGHLLCFSCTSVMKGSICPVMTKVPGKVAREPCEKILEPLNNVQYETHFPEPKAKYHCPFKKFGCQQIEKLIPSKVVEHAQKYCPFRYSLKCIIADCEDGETPIRIGNYLEHIIESHVGREMDLDTHQGTLPLVIYYDMDKERAEDTWVPVLFTDKKKEYLLPFVMKKSGGSIFLWMYSIMERDADKKDFDTELHLTPAPFTKAVLVKKDFIFDNSVSEDDVMKSQNVVKFSTEAFEETYVQKFQDKADAKGETYPYFVVHIKIVPKNCSVKLHNFN